MKYGKQAGQGFVRVGGLGGGPAAEQLPLEGQRGCGAAAIILHFQRSGH